LIDHSDFADLGGVSETPATEILVTRPLQAKQAILARGISILASFLLTIAVARLLGASASGTFFIVFTSLAVFATLARFGTDNLALKLAGAATSNPVNDSVRLLEICASLGVLSVILAVGVYASTRQLLPGIGFVTGVVAVSAIVPQGLSVLAGSILRGHGQLALGTVAELGSIPTITVAILLGGALLLRPTISIGVLALAVGSWLSAVWAVPAAIRASRNAGRKQPFSQPSVPVLSFFRSHMRRLAPMMGTSLLFYVLTWAPVFVLAVTRGPRDVAFFTVAARLAAFITLVPAIQVSYLAPAFARLYHHEQLEALSELCNRSVWQAILAAAVPALALTAAAQTVVRLLYGAGFTAAAVPLVFLAFGALMGIVLGQVTQLMLLCELESSALLLNAGWLFAWITLGLWASSLGGVVAASAFAMGSSVIYAATAAGLLARRRRIYSFARWPVRAAY